MELTATEAAAKARVLARRAAYQAQIDELTTGHRAYIDSLTEERGGEQKTSHASWGEWVDETGFDIGRN